MSEKIHYAHPGSKEAYCKKVGKTSDRINEVTCAACRKSFYKTQNAQHRPPREEDLRRGYKKGQWWRFGPRY